MGGKYQVYSEYKESGVEWLRQVPTEWTVIGIKHLSKVMRGASPRPIDDPKYFDYEGEYAWVRIADVTASDTHLEITTQQLSSLGANLSVKLEPGELFLSIAGSVGKPCITAIKSCIHDGFVYFPELKLNPKYLFYLFAAGEAYKGLGKMGTQLNLNTETVGNIKLGLPSKSEVKKIVTFLDYETARIDRLIEKQQRLIELLKEKRQAVISHAVTKGLDPNVPMKDSGVEWLGQVPEGWKVCKLKHHISTRKGVAFKTQDFCDEGVPVVKASDIKGLSIRGTSTCLPEDFVSLYPKAVLRQGNIVMSTVGSTPDVKNSAVGQIGRVPAELDGTLLNQNTVVFDPDNKRCSSAYLFFVLQGRGYRDHLDLHAHGTANQASLNVADMLDFPIALPSFNVQRELAEEVNVLLTKLSKLEQLCSASQQMLQERRTALISAAVTGKIDVRNWQPPH